MSHLSTSPVDTRETFCRCEMKEPAVRDLITIRAVVTAIYEDEIFISPIDLDCFRRADILSIDGRKPGIGDIVTWDGQKNLILDGIGKKWTVLVDSAGSLVAKGGSLEELVARPGFKIVRVKNEVPF